MLVDLAVGSAELFHTATGIAYADLVIDGHRETLAGPQPQAFRAWLRRRNLRRRALRLAAEREEIEAVRPLPDGHRSCAAQISNNQQRRPLSTRARTTPRDLIPNNKPIPFSPSQ
jgi:hypothetical protein